MHNLLLIRAEALRFNHTGFTKLRDMKNTFRFFLMAFAVGMLGFTGCTDHQERYEDPPWLGGSSIETLEERGNYTIFLELMDRANYTDPIEKQLFTLFVPDDAAFEAYFAELGRSSLSDFTDDECVNLFTLHVLRNPRSRYYLIYEYAWSEFQGPKAEYASLFHRKPTPSESTPYKETVRYLPGEEGKEYTIYTGKKNVALFSQEWFGDYGGAEDGSDYLFMYPGSTWEEGYPEGMEGLNWHNAMVIPNPEIPEEMEVRTSSGFIYFLDRVVGFMPSIEEYMIANQDKYGLYYDVLQRFAAYTDSRIDEERNVEYKKAYELVYDMAEERASSTNEAVPPQNMWSALLPPDGIFQDYLNRTVYQYYDHIDSVPRVTLYYILQSQLSRTLVLPSKIQDGYFNAFGDPTDFGPDDIASGYMCSNGVVYETKRVIEPNVFTTVPGRLFFDKDYSTLLFAFNQANMLSTISNPESDVTVFAADNASLEAYGIRYNEEADEVEFRGPIDGQWSEMAPVDLILFAQDQIHEGILDLNGPEAYAEMASGNHISYGSGQAWSGENIAYDSPVNVVEIEENDQNGLLVLTDNPVQSRLVMGQVLTCNPTDRDCFLADPDMSEFAQILIDLRLLDDRYKNPSTKEPIPRLKFLPAYDYWTALIPTNEAIAQARADGIIPVETPGSGPGKDSMTNFVMNHFIIDDVVFDDGLLSGEFKTNYVYLDTIDNVNVNGRIEIINEPANMTIIDQAGEVHVLDHSKANILVRQGTMHKLDGVLKYYTED